MSASRIEVHYTTSTPRQPLPDERKLRSNQAGVSACQYSPVTASECMTVATKNYESWKAVLHLSALVMAGSR